MKINRDNYESFFLDYLEGTMEETMIDEFLDFLKQNPDLKEELRLFEEIHLPVEPIVFKGKQTLYKSADDESFDRKAVAYMEGDMNEQESRSFEALLEQNLKLQKQYTLFEKTRLVADKNIQFNKKDTLYRKSGTILWLNWMGRAAAVLVLLLGIYSLFQKGEDSRIPSATKQVASVEIPSPSIPQVTESNESESQPVTQHTEPARTVVQGNSLAQHPTRESKTMVDEPAVQREQILAQTITPILPRLESEPVEQALIAIHPVNTEKINDPHNIMTLEEYLASRAKKATKGGILSANRLIQMGLDVASELSGDRLGYTVKNGKVASLEFESKLLAFEVPLEKK